LPRRKKVKTPADYWKEARVGCNVSLRLLQQVTGINYMYIHRIENGEIELNTTTARVLGLGLLEIARLRAAEAEAQQRVADSYLESLPCEC
jgi:hypothetical protein